MAIKDDPATRQQVIDWCRMNQVSFIEADGEKVPPYGWNWWYPDSAGLPLKLERRITGYEIIELTREDVAFNMVPLGSLPVTDSKGNLVGTAHVGEEYKLAQFSKAEVIKWCLDMGVKFDSDLFVSPPGWRWSQRAGEETRILVDNSGGMSTDPQYVVGFKDVYPNVIQPKGSDSRKPDAGAKAREKLMVRAKRKAKRLFLWTLLIVVLAFVAALGGVIYWASKNVHTGYTMVEKQCGIQVGSTFLKATREYSYRYYEVLGARMNFNRDVQEKTILWLDGQSTSIMGLSDKDWWGLTTDGGDRGRQVLKPAKLFTFTIGKSMNVAEYEDFCKPQPAANDGSEQVAKSDTKPTPKK